MGARPRRAGAPGHRAVPVQRVRATWTALGITAAGMGLCPLLGRGAGADDVVSPPAAVVNYQKGLAAARRVHEARRARLAAVPPVAGDGALGAALAAAEARMIGEAEALQHAETLLARYQAAVEQGRAGNEGHGAAGVIGAGADVDRALLTGAASFAAAEEALAGLERATIAARIGRVAREGGPRLVSGVYFAPGLDRIRPRASQAGLADLARLLDMCAEIAVELAAPSVSRTNPGQATAVAAGRAAEVESYLVQTGVPPDRIRKTSAAAGQSGDGPGPEPLGLNRPATSPLDDGEDGQIVVTVVRGCR